MGVVRPLHGRPVRGYASVSSLLMDERAASREPSHLSGHGIPVLARLARTSPHLRTAGYVIAVAGTALVTACFLPFRDSITPLSKGFAYLAVVVAAAATGSLGPGIAASVLGFLSFNYFFLPPYGGFTIARPEFTVVLFVFLGLSIVIAEAPREGVRACANRRSPRGGAPHDPGAEPRAHDRRAGSADLRARPDHGEGRVRIPGGRALRRGDGRGPRTRSSRHGGRTARLRRCHLGSPILRTLARTPSALRRRTDARPRGPERRPPTAHAGREPRPPRVLRPAGPGS